MFEAILANTLVKLDAGDELYILGDLAWNQKTAADALFILQEAGIKVHWVLGNHDRRCAPNTLASACEGIYEALVLPATGNMATVHLAHYPMRVWYNSFRGGWHLYGHVHQFSLEHEVMAQPYGKCLNVNTELYDYFPLSEKDIVLKMAGLPDNFDNVLYKEKKR